MSRILVSGLVNVEVTCSVEKFPIEYEPINYNFFGVNVAAAGVGYNLTKALAALGDDVDIAAMAGKDVASKLVLGELEGVTSGRLVRQVLAQTPASVVLYDRSGARRIYCDLKDVQEAVYDFSEVDIGAYDLAAVCNVNFSRPLLKKAKDAGVKIATDVHVLGDIEDGYNREFMEYADILFLSNEYIIGRERSFAERLAERYDNEIIVVGCGGAGALMYVRAEGKFYDMPAAKPEKIVNTVGAGDCLFGTFISLYAKKEFSPEECLMLAQRAAAHKIGYDGAAKGFLTWAELMGKRSAGDS